MKTFADASQRQPARARVASQRAGLGEQLRHEWREDRGRPYCPSNIPGVSIESGAPGDFLNYE
jgi:hypothetical protein